MISAKIEVSVFGQCVRFCVHLKKTGQHLLMLTCDYDNFSILLEVEVSVVYDIDISDKVVHEACC